MKRHVSLPPKSRRTARRGYTHRYTVSVHMIELRNRNFVRQLKNDIASGLIGDVELRGFGLEESMAMGVLLDTDPAKLASSSDIPVTISLLDRHEAFVTFGEYRLMKQERLMDWLDMVQTGTFRTIPDIEPSTEVLPRLHKPEGATASTPLDAVRLMMDRYESSKHHQEREPSHNSRGDYRPAPSRHEHGYAVRKPTSLAAVGRFLSTYRLQANKYHTAICCGNHRPEPFGVSGHAPSSPRHRTRHTSLTVGQHCNTVTARTFSVRIRARPRGKDMS